MRVARIVAVVVGCGIAGLAWAYKLECNSADDKCKVICNNGQLAGEMFWNGTNWSDGLRWDPDRNKVASQMVAAQGTACQ